MIHNLIDSLRNSQLSLIEYQSTLGNDQPDRLHEIVYLKSLGRTLQAGTDELSQTSCSDDLEAMGCLVDEFAVVVSRFISGLPAPVL